MENKDSKTEDRLNEELRLVFQNKVAETLTKRKEENITDSKNENSEVKRD